MSDLSKADLLAWLRRTARKAAMEEMHEVHEHLALSAELIAKHVPESTTLRTTTSH